MNYPQYLARVTVVTAIVLLAPALLNLYVDPFQVYHKTLIPGAGLPSIQRYTNVGLINSYLADPAEGYDSVMIGTSLSDNFTTAEAAIRLRWQKPLRLFIDGGSPIEQAIILNHALHTGRVEHVLWELLSPSFADLKDVAQQNEWQFPDYLYNANPLDDTHYFFNFDVLKMSRQLLSGNISTYNYTEETIGYWADLDLVLAQHARFNSPENLQAIDIKGRDLLVPLNDLQVNQFSYSALDSQVLPLLDAHCNTGIEFSLFIPPLSRARFPKLAGIAYKIIYMPRHVLQRIEPCKNIRLYAFDLMSFTNDLNNYKDESHYGLHISNMLLTLIGKREHVLTLQNVHAYEEGFIRNINEYTPYTSYPASVAPVL